MDNENEKLLQRRSRILLGIFSLCLALFVLLLYDAQVVDHEEYLARSATQVTTSTTVEASRGVVTDRNGKLLTSNREIYIIDFDPDDVETEDDAEHSVAVSRALLRLITLCQEKGRHSAHCCRQRFLLHHLHRRLHRPYPLPELSEGNEMVRFRAVG